MPIKLEENRMEGEKEVLVARCFYCSGAVSKYEKRRQKGNYTKCCFNLYSGYCNGLQLIHIKTGTPLGSFTLLYYISVCMYVPEFSGTNFASRKSL